MNSDPARLYQDPAFREWAVSAARHNAIISRLQTEIQPTLEGPPIDHKKIMDGLQFEQWLCAAISGSNAIMNVAPIGERASLIQGATSLPDSYRRLTIESEITVPWDADHPVLLDVMRSMLRQAGAVSAEGKSMPTVFWWEGEAADRDLVSCENPGIARVGLAAELYLAMEPGHSATPEMVKTVESLMGQISTIRAHLLESKEDLTASAQHRQAQLLEARSLEA